MQEVVQIVMLIAINVKQQELITEMNDILMPLLYLRLLFRGNENAMMDITQLRMLIIASHVMLPARPVSKQTIRINEIVVQMGQQLSLRPLLVNVYVMMDSMKLKKFAKFALIIVLPVKSHHIFVYHVQEGTI